MTPKVMRLFALVLAVTMICALTACGEPSVAGANDSTAPLTTAQAAAEPAVVPTAEPTVEPTAEPTAKPEAAEWEVTYKACRTNTNSIGSLWCQVIVEITNTGTVPLYLSSSSYDLEDSTGALVASEKYVSTYPCVIEPGAVGYMYNETILDNGVAGAEYTVVEHLDIEPAKIDGIALEVTDLTVSDDKYSGVKAMGRVNNTTAETQKLVYVVVVLYDAEGTPIGVLDTILMDDLAAGDKVGFEAGALQLPPDVTADRVAETAVYAYPLQYQF